MLRILIPLLLCSIINRIFIWQIEGGFGQGRTPEVGSLWPAFTGHEGYEEVVGRHDVQSLK